MKPYPKYKDSGIQWIGKIPEGWETTRGKNMMNQVTTKSNSSVKVALENIESESGKLVTTESIFDGNGIAFSKGDVLYGKLRPYLKKVWLAEFDGNAVGDFFVYSRNKENSIPAFIKYLLLSDNFTKVANESTNGAKMPRVPSEFVLKLHFPLPPLSEQQAIVAYLDDKTSKLDECVRLLELQKADLTDYRKAIITKTVTRGLNPNAKLKDSGVDWIGQIPEGWMVDKVKNHILYIKSGDAIKYEKNNPSGDIPLYGGGAQIGYVDKSNTEIGDILIGRVGANCGCVTEVQQQSWATDNALIVRPKILSRYLVYILDSANLNKLSTSNAQPLVTSSKIKDFGIPIAPLPEQQAIADYLDIKTSKIDETIKRIDEQINDLRAYRTALISDVVTGKIDVRN